MSRAIRNCRRWSDIVTSGIELRVITGEQLQSIRVFELFLSLVDCIICGRIIREQSEFRNSFGNGDRLYFNKSMLKSPRRKAIITFLKKMYYFYLKFRKMLNLIMQICRCTNQFQVYSKDEHSLRHISHEQFFKFT